MRSPRFLLIATVAVSGCGVPSPPADELASPTPANQARVGRITGTVEVPAYATGSAFVGAGKRLDTMSSGRPTALARVGADGRFALEGLPAGTYFLAAYIDGNMDGVPDRFAEPFVLWPETVTIAGATTVTGIVLRNFLNLADPTVRTPERQARVASLTAAAEAAFKAAAAANLPDAARPDRLLATVRIHIHEATQRWRFAADESTWAFVEEMLAAIPEWVAQALDGIDPLADRRGWQLLGYVRAADRAVLPYLLYVPPAYDPAEPMPLVLTLHPGGGTHWSGARMVQGLSSLADSGPDRDRAIWPPPPPGPMLVAVPLGDNRLGPMPWRRLGEANALHVLDAVTRAYTVDPDRVYLTGEGDGGRGAWDLGVRYPNRFAAILVGSGATDVARHFCMNLAHTPVRVIHGRDDAIIPVSHARAIVQEAAQYDAKWEYLEVDRGHEINDLCYGDGAAFTWFARHRRAAASPLIRFRSDRLAYNEGAGVVIDERGPAEGYMDVLVEWQSPGRVHIVTRNVAALTLVVPPGEPGPVAIECNGGPLRVEARPAAIALRATGDPATGLVWSAAPATAPVRHPLGPWARTPST